MGREFELKFAATAEKQAEIEADFSGWHTITMSTTYYDTPKGALSAGHITLRRRLENGKSVCTLKTPTGGIGRGEWELECDSIEEALPELCKLSGWDLHPLLPQGLVAVCAARFVRKACTVALPQCTVEIALDCGKLLGGGTEIPLTEVEFEKKSGTDEAVAAYAAALAKKYSLSPEHRSKFRRALALARGENNGAF